MKRGARMPRRVEAVLELKALPFLSSTASG
jgi:hypothetical protein